MKKICKAQAKIREIVQAQFKSPGPKYSKICTYRFGVLSILLVILLGLASQIKIFGEAPPNPKSELRISGYLLVPYLWKKFHLGAC
jgi:hypothetical protein